MFLEKSFYLSEKEHVMYEIVLKVLDGNLTRKQAAARLGVSQKTIGRKIDIFLKEGAKGLAHKSRGSEPINKTDGTLLAQVVLLYETRYIGYNFTHFHQKLTEVEHIKISYPVLYYLLTRAGFISPKANRAKKKNLHPTRKRRKCFGELVQMDASFHEWFSDIVCNLHLAIDDATSQILGGHFEEQETLHGYFILFAQILKLYGAPEEFYTDKRTVFTSSKIKESHLEKDAGTQFRMAAARFGVLQIHTTSVPQAKGRIERAFNTFQDRLISEMRVAKITTIDEANAFLPGFIADHNVRYSLDETNLKNVFTAKPSEEEISMGLSVVHNRMVNNGSCISFKNKIYAPYSNKERILIKSKTKVLVLKTLDEKLYLVNGINVWPLINMQTQSLPTPKDLQGKLYVPPKNHPWKEASYQMMIKKIRRAS
jgi:transposase